LRPVSDAKPTFELVVDAVFTITGRGLVATGVPSCGSPQVGDPVAVHHGSDVFVATCAGIERIRILPGYEVDPGTIGLLLPGLTAEQVAAGDVVRTLAGSARPGAPREPE
jgi:translation elongation factor EF-Tu-like GTPase